MHTADSHGWLPLHFAARNCINLSVVTYLLEQHIDAVAEATALQQLPYLVSMANKSRAVAELLLSCNADAVDRYGCIWGVYGGVWGGLWGVYGGVYGGALQ